MSKPIVLASASPFRRMLLDNAGVPFSWQAAAIDERVIEDQLVAKGATPQAVALALADAKAADIAKVRDDALVIGSDQTLSLGTNVFHKPKDVWEARNHLRALSGQTHQLNSAIVIRNGGMSIWSHLSTARLTMRSLKDDFIERHLNRVGSKALGSVGAYQLEGEGIQLFEAIDGDYFTILGLPLLPLLQKLRDLGAIDA